MRWNLFSSNAQAGPSTAVPNSSPSNAQHSSRKVIEEETETPAARYESILRDEEQYQSLQYPSFEEVPGCMRLFDEFLMSYTLVPQLRNIYRYGELRDSGWKFEDFKYCLSLKSESEEVRRQLWIKRKAEWWANRRVSGSSEDVWDARKVPLTNFPPLDPDDEGIQDTTA